MGCSLTEPRLCSWWPSLACTCATSSRVCAKSTLTRLCRICRSSSALPAATCLSACASVSPQSLSLSLKQRARLISTIAGILMLQASQHFVSRASSTDSMPEGASVAAVPADDVAAPVGASTATADDKPPAAPQVRPRKTRAANGLAKTESDAPAVPNGGGAQRVTRSKSAALKQEDSHVAPATTATATKSKAKR